MPRIRDVRVSLLDSQGNPPIFCAQMMGEDQFLIVKITVDGQIVKTFLIGKEIELLTLPKEEAHDVQ